MQDILETVDNWLQQGQTVALATVAETWGSSPRPVGAKMAVTQAMAMIGSVSGGCVETAVVEEALASLASGQPRLLHFGVSDESAWEVGLACGGKISVFVEPLDTAWWQTVSQSVREHHLLAAITVLDGPSAGKILHLDATSGATYTSPNFPDDQREMFKQAAQAALERKQSGKQRVGEFDVLIDMIRPEPRLIIVGGAHVSIALQNLAHLMGFQIIVVDPRQVFATHERFPNVGKIMTSYPDKAFAQLGLDTETYIAVLSHDPKIDDPALRVALQCPVGYIGVLSSKRAHQQRIERLTTAGVDPSLFERIHTPIGLDIGAKTPEEIALAIMGEIIAVRNGVRA